MTLRTKVPAITGHVLLGAISCILLPAISSPLAAAGFSFAGDFHQDDEQRTFSISLAKAGAVSVRTLSYAGGTSSAGVVVPAGGFDPTLAIFDQSGKMLGVNRDAGCNSAAADPVTRLCWDAALSLSLPAGVYQVVLTESDNLPFGPTLQDGFVYFNAANFTADPISGTSDGFWDLSLHHRTTAYAVDIVGADSAQLGLTPTVSALTNAASALAGQISPNDVLTYYDPALIGGKVTATVNGEPATVIFSGTGQINIVMPGDLASGTSVIVQISQGGSILLSSMFTIAPVDPALFTDNSRGTGQGAILNQDYTLNGPASPAAVGSFIIVYGTGFGAVSSPGSDGLSRILSGVTATVGGILADVTYAGLVPGETPGLQQINIRLPNNVQTGSAVPIQLSVGSVSTQQNVTVAIR